jgi:hypothetical protein
MAEGVRFSQGDCSPLQGVEAVVPFTGLLKWSEQAYPIVFALASNIL